MTDIELPSFDAVNQALKNIKAVTEPAEVHGLLCALLSAGADVQSHAWIDSMISGFIEEGDVKAQEGVETLHNLFNATKSQYQSGYYDLDLLLPDDTDKFYLRIGALAMWCQGFLSGLALAGFDLQHPPTEDIKEALEDLEKFSRLQYDFEIEGHEEDEQAFTELVEYSKIAALLIHSEFAKNVQQKD